jgi:hypothetical protein
VEASWNSFSRGYTTAVLQSIPAFPLAETSVGPRSFGQVFFLMEFARVISNAQTTEIACDIHLPEKKTGRLLKKTIHEAAVIVTGGGWDNPNCARPPITF